MRQRIFWTGWCLGIALITGCVSIPQETVHLSSEIGARITESRGAHLALVRQYMAEKRERIDLFVSKEWIPEFARKVFEKETIKNEWERIVASDDKSARLDFITGLGMRLQQKINSKRQALIAPINELEQALTLRINNHYDEILAANTALTAFLVGATKVKERQQEALRILKVEGKLPKWMASADKVVGKILSGRGGYEKNKDKIDKIIDRLRSD